MPEKARGHLAAGGGSSREDAPIMLAPIRCLLLPKLPLHSPPNAFTRVRSIDH
jgi:hypothetical protein